MRRNLETTLEKVGRILSRQYNITVKCKGNKCQTDGRTIWLPSIPDELSESAWTLIRGDLDHETAHILFSDFEGRLKTFRQDWGDFGFDMLNIIEDVRVNCRMAELYPGSHINIWRCIQMITSEHDIAQMILPSRFLCALFMAGMEMPYAPYGDDASELVERFREEASRFRRLQSTDEACAMAESILRRLRHEQPESESSQELESDDTSQPEQSSTDTESNESGSEARNTETAPSSNNDSSQDGGEEQSDCPDVAEEVQDTDTPENPSASMTEEDGQDAESERETAIRDPWGNFYESNGHPLEISGELEQVLKETSHDSDLVYRVYDANRDQVLTPAAQDGGTTYRELLSQVRPHIAPLRQRLLRTLRARDARFWAGEHDEGVVNSRDLHALLCRGSTKVFRQLQEVQSNSVALTLLVDLSGSMSGPRIELARQIALLFAETLNQLQMAHEVLGFTTLDFNKKKSQLLQETGRTLPEIAQDYARFVPCRFSLFKGFDEPYKVIKDRIGAMEASEYTPLGDALLFAAQRIVRRSETRKIIFVLTDGEPCTGNTLRQMAVIAHLERTLEQITRAGIECVGIGILTNSVQRFFKNSLAVHDLHGFPKAFYAKFAETLRRS